MIGWPPRTPARGDLIPVETAAAARKVAAKRKPHAALLDVDLPDGSGIALGLQLRMLLPQLQVTLMTSSDLDREEEEFCEESELPVIQKPFLVGEVMSAIRKRLLEAA